MNRSLPFLTAALAATIFAVDTVTDYEIALATFYVVVVLLSQSFCQRRGVIAVSAACMVLTLLSYHLTPDGNFRTGIINTSISLLAIGATTFLALKIEAARSMAHEAQLQLARVARATTLGELMASIAHEINQPLAAVITNANACARWLGAEPPNLERASRSIHDIVSDANRASEIIKRIRAHVTQTEISKEWIDLNEVVQQSLILTRRQIDERQIALRLSLAKDLPLILADRVQLEQVVINLLVNALESQSGSAGEEQIVQIRTRGTDDCGIELSVEDTGQGLDPAVSDSLFEAFTTTKQGGMGIGLAICRSIIEGHGGRIWAEPNSPRGAIFKVTLPGERT